MEDSSSIIAVISAIVALLSVIVSVIIAWSNKASQKYDNLMRQITTYSKPEMMLSIRRLWDLYRDYGESNFLNKYIEIVSKEEKILTRKMGAEKLGFTITTLHYQRRMVAAFWRGLAVLLRNGLVPKKAVYQWWNQNDVEIIIKILLPLEDRVSEHFHISKLKEGSDPLYYLRDRIGNFYK